MFTAVHQNRCASLFQGYLQVLSDSRGAVSFDSQPSCSEWARIVPTREPLPVSTKPGGDMNHFRLLVGAVLLGALWSTTALAQQRSLHGTVTDLNTGAPVVSATVSVKGRAIAALNGSNPPAGGGLERTYPPPYNWPLPQNEQNARNGVLTKQCPSGA